MAGFDDDFDGFKDDDFNFDSSDSNDFNFGGSSDDGDDDLFSDGDGEDLDLEDTSGTQLRSNAGTEESDEAANRIKKVAFFGIGIAIAIVVIICIIVRISAGVKAKENNTNKNVNTQETMVEQVYSNNTAVGDQNAQAQVSVGTGWIEISDTNWEFTSQKQEGTMSVTSVHVYANYNTTAGEAQLKTIVVGGISGLAGTYELDLPVELTGLVNLGTKLQVEYDMTTDSNGDIIVGNISIKE